MNRFIKWMMRCPLIAKCLFGFPIVLAVGVISAIGSQPKIITFIFGFIMLLFVIFSVDTCYVGPATKAANHLNDTCDYEPLLAVTTEIEGLAKPSPTKQAMEINLALAHICKGDFITAKNIMSRINIDKFSGVAYQVKLVYYNNLAEIEDHLGNKEAADLYFDKLYKMYGDLKPGKQRAALESTVNSALAAYLYRNGDCAEALKIMDALKPNCRCAAVQNACLHARILIALGENDRAREALNFAIANGGKLYVVGEAEKMLASIS